MRRPLPTFFEQHSEPLEQRIVTALHKLGLAMKQQSWHLASEGGLSPTQGQILAALGDGGPLTGSAIAAKLGVTLPTVSDAVRALKEKGLVDKRPDARHPRATLVELTPAGRERTAVVRSWPDFLASAVGALDEAEREAFFSGLLKMIRTLQEEGRIPVHRMCIQCRFFRPNVHDAPLPHHCALVDAPMGARHLRLDCAEHEEADATERKTIWERFAAPR